MKIILFPFNYCNKSETKTFLDRGVMFPLSIPDSALMGTKIPFFIPDFAETCTASVHVALRICRLGRCIGEKYAHRYFDAVTAAVNFTAHPLLEHLRQSGLPWDAACGFDTALALGKWKQKEHAGPFPGLSAALQRNGKEIQRVSTTNLIADADKLIVEASKVFTLRTGDVLLTGSPPKGIPVEINDHLTILLGEEKVIEFNVK